jgi:transcriptional regulator with XRE-family HTH domain
MATHGNDLVREARKRARLTQRELAGRAGTTQSAVARLESGRTRPAFDDVLRLVRLCGFDLDTMLVVPDESDRHQALALRELTPSERVERSQHVARQLQTIREAGARSGAA